MFCFDFFNVYLYVYKLVFLDFRGGVEIFLVILFVFILYNLIFIEYLISKFLFLKNFRFISGDNKSIFKIII